MQFFSSMLLALGIASTAHAAALASNSVFYGAYEGQNEGGTGCTGGFLGSVNQGRTGSSACKDVGEGACVTLTGHTGDATKCKVAVYESVGCPDDEESTNIFGKNGEFYNENFASFKAICT